MKTKGGQESELLALLRASRATPLGCPKLGHGSLGCFGGAASTTQPYNPLPWPPKTQLCSRLCLELPRASLTHQQPWEGGGGGEKEGTYLGCTQPVLPWSLCPGSHSHPSDPTATPPPRGSAPSAPSPAQHGLSAPLAEAGSPPLRCHLPRDRGQQSPSLVPKGHWGAPEAPKHQQNPKAPSSRRKTHRVSRPGDSEVWDFSSKVKQGSQVRRDSGSGKRHLNLELPFLSQLKK